MIECRDAVARGIIIPVAVEAFELFAPPADLRQLNWFDLVDWNGGDDNEEWQRTLQNLGKLVGRDLTGTAQETLGGGRLSIASGGTATGAGSPHDGTLKDLRATWAGLAADRDIRAVERFFKHVQAVVPGSGLEFEIENHLDWLRQDAEHRARIAEAAKAERLAKRAREDEARRSKTAARLEPGKVWRDIIPGMPVDTLPEMVTVAPSSTAPSRTVKNAAAPDGNSGAIENSFAMARYPVTYADLDAAIAVGANMERPADQGQGRGRRVAVNVSWNDASAYVDWLNERLGLCGRDDAYRLPSSAEWEYALGANALPCEDQAHGKDAGSCSGNALGLHSARDDLWEWCGASETSRITPEGQGHKPRAQVLQASRLNTPDLAGERPANAQLDPATRREDIGFRLARSLPQGVSPSTA